MGKTSIGLSLLVHELLTKRRKGDIPRAFLICPAQLRDLVWRSRIQQFGIPGVEIRSHEVLGIVARLSKRIAEMDRTVGLDGSVLGEVISERLLDQIRRQHTNEVTKRPFKFLDKLCKICHTE